MALEFKIELSGNFAGALEKDAAASEKAGEAHKKHKHELEAFEAEIGKAKAGLGGFEINLEALSKGGALFTFDLAEGLRTAVELTHELVEGVLDLGKEMVKAAGDAEDLNLAIKLDVGEEGLEKVDKLAESFKGTRFSPKAIKESLLPILEESGDEHNEQWNDLVTAATDVATRRKTGAAGAKAALESLRGIEIQPQRIRGALKDLGIKQKDFYSDLGDLLGIQASAAEKQVKAGQIKAQTLLSVALHQIAEREGGSLGNATNEGTKTLGSSLERLANIKDELFEKLAGSKGMQMLQGAIDNFVDTLEGPVGTDLMQTIDEGFQTLFGDLSGPQGLEKIKAGVLEAADDVKSLVKEFQEAWPAIKADAEALWEVVKGIAKTVGMIVDGWVKLENFAHDWDSGQIQKDIVDTIKGEHGGIANDAVNENSPAWKKAKAAGVSVPAFADGGYVDRPTLAIVGDNGPEWMVPEKQRSAFADLAATPAPSSGSSSSTGDITYAPQYHIGGGESSAALRDLLEQHDRASRLEFKRIMAEIRAAS